MPSEASTSTQNYQQQVYLELAELAGSFIHEIKNHLNTLSLNLQLLAEDFEQPQSPRERKALERVTRLGDECSRLVELSNDFLRFARMTDVKRQPVSMGPLVERLIDFLGPVALAQGIEIDWFPAGDLPQVNLDVDLFEKVLLNLMQNSLEAMPNGGRLTLIASRVDNKLNLAIIDTGCGIDQELQARVFQPFVTTKTNGSGLGLATVRKIVQAHEGTILLHSEPGRGSQFIIELPISFDHAIVEIG